LEVDQLSTRTALDDCSSKDVKTAVEVGDLMALSVRTALDDKSTEGVSTASEPNSPMMKTARLLSEPSVKRNDS
jgi:hypothetical protein